MSKPAPTSSFPAWAATTSGIAREMDSIQPGSGQQYLAFIARYAGHPAEGTYPPDPPGNDSPLDWYAGYLLVGQFPDILAGAIQAGAGLVPQAVAAASIGIGQAIKPPTGLTAIANFFASLSQANTWLRTAEVILGVLLAAVGIARATGGQNALSRAVKARIP